MEIAENKDIIKHVVLQVAPIEKGCLRSYQDPPNQFITCADKTMFQILNHKLQKLFKFPLQLPCSLIEGKQKKSFVASGSKILGYSKKGNEIFYFDTFMAQSIKYIAIDQPKLWAASQHLINQFKMGIKVQEIAYYSSNQRILDMVLMHQGYESYPLIVVPSKLISLPNLKKVQISLDKNIICLENYITSPSLLLAGCESGEILLIDPLKKQIQFEKAGEGRIEKIVSLKKCTVVGRIKGRIEIWNNHQNHIQALWFTKINDQMISAVYISRDDKILIGARSGKIYELTSHEQLMNKKMEVQQSVFKSKTSVIKIDYDQQIRQLQKQLQKERNKVQLNSAIPQIGSRVTTTLSQDCFIQLNIQCQISFQRIIIQSKYQLLVSNCQKWDNVYSWQFQPRNLHYIKIKTEEGEPALLTIIIFPANHQSIVSKQITIKAFPYHYPSAKQPPTESPRNSIVFKGNFFQPDMYRWIDQLFQEVPKQVQDQVYYESRFSRTWFKGLWKTGYAQFSSDSLIVINGIKKQIINRAKQINKKITFNKQCNEQTVQLNIVHLGEQIKQLQKVDSVDQVLKEQKMIPAIKELVVFAKGQNVSVKRQWRQIYQRSNQILQKSKIAEHRLYYFKKTIWNTLIAYSQYKQVELKEHHHKNYQRIFTQFDLQKMLQFIQQI